VWNDVVDQQLVDVIQHLLRALERKAGDDEIAAGGVRGVDDLCDLTLYVFAAAMYAITVGGFHEDVIRLPDVGRVANDRAVGPAHVAGKEHAAPFAVDAGADTDDRRAQDVAGLAEHGVDVFGDLHDLAVLDRREQRERRLRVFGRVQRDFRIRAFAPLALVTLALVLGVLFLDLGRIQHDDSRDLRRGGRAVDPSLETVLHQLRQQTAMIQVRVGQQHRVDAGRREVKRLPVPCLELTFLIQTAVHEKACAVDLQKVTRPGDVLRRAEEAEFHLHVLVPLGKISQPKNLLYQETLNLSRPPRANRDCVTTSPIMACLCPHKNGILISGQSICCFVTVVQPIL